jgi:hypothetical protein
MAIDSEGEVREKVKMIPEEENLKVWTYEESRSNEIELITGDENKNSMRLEIWKSETNEIEIYTEAEVPPKNLNNFEKKEAKPKILKKSLNGITVEET